MGYLPMAVAMPVWSPKQSARFAATLYSPPETWTSTERAFRNGITPGSSRWTRAPTERNASPHWPWRTFKPLMDAPISMSLCVNESSGPDLDEDLQRFLVFEHLH